MANTKYRKWKRNIDRRFGNTYNRDTKDKRANRNGKFKKMDNVFRKSNGGGK